MNNINIKSFIIPEENKLLLNDMLNDVCNLLDSHNIAHWIDGGTLLGSVRHGGQIPWDDDVDIGVLIKDYNKLTFILKKLPDKYKTTFENPLIKVYIPKLWYKNQLQTFATPTLDIFPWKLKDDKYKLNSSQQMIKWPNCYHNEKDLFPLIKYKFDGKYFYGPKNPLPYLDRMYKDWQTKAVVEIRKFADPQNKNETIIFDLHEEK